MCGCVVWQQLTSEVIVEVSVVWKNHILSLNKESVLAMFVLSGVYCKLPLARDRVRPPKFDHATSIGSKIIRIFWGKKRSQSQEEILAN